MKQHKKTSINSFLNTNQRFVVKPAAHYQKFLSLRDRYLIRSLAFVSHSSLLQNWSTKIWSLHRTKHCRRMFCSGVVLYSHIHTKMRRKESRLESDLGARPYSSIREYKKKRKISLIKMVILERSEVHYRTLVWWQTPANLRGKGGRVEEREAISCSLIYHTRAMLTTLCRPGCTIQYTKGPSDASLQRLFLPCWDNTAEVGVWLASDLELTDAPNST